MHEDNDNDDNDDKDCCYIIAKYLPFPRQLKIFGPKGKWPVLKIASVGQYSCVVISRPKLPFMNY